MTALIIVFVGLLSFSQHATCMSLCEAGNGSYIMDNRQSLQSVVSGAGAGAGLYLNLNYPAPCSGRITSYQYCYKYDGPESSSFTIDFSLWNCQENRNCQMVITQLYVPSEIINILIA